jgi:hypothetical protein
MYILPLSGSCSERTHFYGSDPAETDAEQFPKKL